jgi:tetraprenyl-beta-curcumene synthase
MAASALAAPPTGASPALGDRRLAARAGLVLVLANVRYWTSVAPVVRRELNRWRLRAEEIEDPELRALALEKLDGEGFHAEAAAMLATLAPRPHRAGVIEAIVALELLFDYLDGLTELPSRDPLADGERAFGALIDAVTVRSAVTCERPGLPPRCDDRGYLESLSRTVSTALARLPVALAITEVAQQIASRSGEAQTRMHAASQLGMAQLEEWASTEAQGTGLDWREFLAGSAASVLALHALVAAAANADTTPAQAQQIAEAYLPACVVLTLLDGLVDYDHDKAPDGSERPGYLSLFEDRDELPEMLAQAARRAATQARGLPNGAHHVMLLTGAVAYYSSAPGAEGEEARPAIARLRRELAPLMSPTFAVMRTWRGARRRARSFRANEAGESYDETSAAGGTVESTRCCG